MSKYVNKQALLKWLEQRHRENIEEFEVDRSGEDLEIINEIKSGAFDVDQTEVQRLRAALVKVNQLLDEDRENDGAFQSWSHMQAWKVATQALAATVDNAGEEVGTEEWWHKHYEHYGAEWPEEEEGGSQ